MKKIIYSCPFVPPEWITAHNMEPCRIGVHSWNTEKKPVIGETSGICVYARAFANQVIFEKKASAVVITTVCDQMRRISELIKKNCNLPIFLMNIPSTWQTTTAHKIYMTELKRLGRFMIRMGGNSPSKDNLAKVMDKYNTARSYIRSARAYLSPRQYSETILNFYRNGITNFTVSDYKNKFVSRGIPLAIVGGPLLSDYFNIFDIIESSGGSIVLDGSKNGERTMPPPFDRRLLKDSPLEVLADAYFGKIPDAFRRPNSELYRWLKKEINQREIKGIILLRYVWCDIWHAEIQRIKEWAGLPLLDLDISDDVDKPKHIASRIQPFIEILKSS
jgi:benzoyl-CoA reductase/2-hydroxyglutaryl-CoA dehydratase subunit BcrC/BadD/HgdB